MSRIEVLDGMTGTGKTWSLIEKGIKFLVSRQGNAVIYYAQEKRVIPEVMKNLKVLLSPAQLKDWLIMAVYSSEEGKAVYRIGKHITESRMKALAYALQSLKPVFLITTMLPELMSRRNPITGRTFRASLLKKKTMLLHDEMFASWQSLSLERRNLLFWQDTSSILIPNLTVKRIADAFSYNEEWNHYNNRVWSSWKNTQEKRASFPMRKVYRLVPKNKASSRFFSCRRSSLEFIAGDCLNGYCAVWANADLTKQPLPAFLRFIVRYEKEFLTKFFKKVILASANIMANELTAAGNRKPHKPEEYSIFPEGKFRLITPEKGQEIELKASFPAETVSRFLDYILKFIFPEGEVLLVMGGEHKKEIEKFLPKRVSVINTRMKGVRRYGDIRQAVYLSAIVPPPSEIIPQLECGRSWDGIRQELRDYVWQAIGRAGRNLKKNETFSVFFPNKGWADDYAQWLRLKGIRNKNIVRETEDFIPNWKKRFKTSFPHMNERIHTFKARVASSLYGGWNVMLEEAGNAAETMKRGTPNPDLQYFGELAAPRKEIAYNLFHNYALDSLKTEEELCGEFNINYEEVKAEKLRLKTAFKILRKLTRG